MPDELVPEMILERQILRCYNEHMQNEARHPSTLTDEQLLSSVKALACAERQATAKLIAALAELDARRLYLGEGFASLFTYCTQALHLSEHAAYGRIEAARTARRFPDILDLLADGSLTLTTVRLLAPHLTPNNCADVLAAGRHRSKREVEQQVVALRPLPPVPAVVRKLPNRSPRSAGAETCMPAATIARDSTPSSAIAARPAGDPRLPVLRAGAVVAPLAPERYRVQFTISRETHAKLRRVQDLLRHTVPDGDPAVIFDRALTVLLTSLEANKLGRTDRPRKVVAPKAGSHHVPAAVKREVWQRDGGQCAFVGSAGRCTERGFLEFHHVVPFAYGGETTTANLQLRCRAHNAHEADVMFRDPASLFAEEDLVQELGPDRVG